MKKHIRIIGVLQLLALYCIVIFSYTSWSHLAFEKAPAEKFGDRFTLPAAALFCHTIQTETIVKGLNNLPFSFQNHIVDFSVRAKAAAMNFVNILTIHFQFLENIKVRLQKTVIIFPFHCFW